MTGVRPPLIVHCIHRLEIGGLENGIVNLVNRMPAERYRHAIICLAGFNPAFRARIDRPGVEVLSLDKRPGKDPRAYLRMWRTLRSLRPDLLHTRNLGTVDMQWAAFAAGVRHRVHGEHGWEATDPRGLNARSLRIRRACRPVIQRYVPMSRDIARWLEASVGVEPRRIRQIYNGVDTEKFTPSPRPATVPDSDGGSARPPAEAGESRSNVPSLTIGTIGRLDPVKNHASLLEAFLALSPQVPTLRLVIVGDGPLRNKLETQAATLGIGGRVTFTGARGDTAALMRSFDVFVLPSVNEGISNTILEAMATGLPVVAGRVGGNPELVVDGVTGRLYEAGQPDALSQALLPYLTHSALRHAHGDAGRARVVQNFSLDAMVTRYLALYDELVSQA